MCLDNGCEFLLQIHEFRREFTVHSARSHQPGLSPASYQQVCLPTCRMCLWIGIGVHWAGYTLDPRLFSSPFDLCLCFYKGRTRRSRGTEGPNTEPGVLEEKGGERKLKHCCLLVAPEPARLMASRYSAHFAHAAPAELGASALTTGRPVCFPLRFLFG